MTNLKNIFSPTNVFGFAIIFMILVSVFMISKFVVSADINHQNVCAKGPDNTVSHYTVGKFTSENGMTCTIEKVYSPDNCFALTQPVVICK